MKCPRCDKQELAPRKVKGKDIALDICPKCKGVWFDRGELERAIPEAVNGLALPEDAERGSGECPRCWGTMYSFIYPGTFVQVDMCGRCNGLWLDAGEINEIRVVRKALKNAPRSRKPNDAGGLLRFLDNVFGSSGQSD
jgi:Zn-finger nucleic acid-binding protein